MGERLGIERADAVWAVAEDWAGARGSQDSEVGPMASWRVQLGVGADGDL